jgi:PPM family protein phosphatase
MCKFWKKLKLRKATAKVELPREELIDNESSESEEAKTEQRAQTGDNDKTAEKTLHLNSSQESEEEEAPTAIITARVTDNLIIIPSNFQHIGARNRQEDSFVFSDLADADYVAEHGILAVVADGMGGLAGGDKASHTAVKTMLRDYEAKHEDEDLNQFLRRMVRVANYAVFDLAYSGGEEELEIGTTLVAAALRGNELAWVSVGDSKVLLISGDNIEQLNSEHIYANKLMKDFEKGLITRKEAEEHPERAYLTSYLGLSELNEIDCCSENLILEAGDKVLLCSDGLTDTLTLKEIRAALDGSSGGFAEKLVEKALEKNRRHQDNITVIVLSCEAINDKGDENEEY